MLYIDIVFQFKYSESLIINIKTNAKVILIVRWS